MKPIKYILLLILLLASIYGFSQSQQSVSYNLVCWDSSSVIRTLKLRTYEVQGLGSVSEYRDLITNNVVVPTVGIVADCAIIASNMCNTADTSIYTYNGTIPDGVDRHVFFEDDSRLDFVRPDGGRMLYLNQADSQVIITTFNNKGTLRAKLDQLEMNYLNTGIFYINDTVAMFYEGRGIGNRFGIEYQNPTSSEWRPNTLITKQYFEDNDVSLYTADGEISENRVAQLTGDSLSFLDATGAVRLLGYNTIGPKYIWGFQSQDSLAQVYSGSNEVGMFSPTIGEFSFDTNTDKAVFNDTRATKLGFEYLADYSAGILTNNRSIPDVGMVNALISDSLGSLSLPTIFTSSGSITGNNNIDLDMANFLSWRDNDDVIRMRWGNLEEKFETWTKSEVSSVGADATTLYFKGTTVGGLTLDETAETFVFEDERAGGSQAGIEYAADYSADFTDRSLVDKAYVDAAAGGGDYTFDAQDNTIGTSPPLTLPVLALKNIMLGYNVANSTLTGDNNICIGEASGEDLVTGQGNVMIGRRAGTGTTNGTDNVIIGDGAGDSSVNNSQAVVIGSGANSGTAACTDGVVIGYDAGLKVSSRATVIGFQAGQDVRQDNVMIGWEAGKNCSQADKSVFVGNSVGQNVTGDNNTAVGHAALSDVSATIAVADNTILGAFAALNYTDAEKNVVIGSSANSSGNGGDKNVMIGYDVADEITTGSDNVIIGNIACDNTSDAAASNAVVIGSNSGKSASSLDSAIIVGFNSGVSNSFFQPIIIGNAATANQNFQIVLGTQHELRVPGYGANAHLMDEGTFDRLVVTDGADGSFGETTLQDILRSYTIADYYTDVANTDTDENDLYTETLVANLLDTDGQKLKATYSGTFTDATATADMRLYFGSTEIFDSGVLTLTGTGVWSIEVLFIRSGTTTARAIVTMQTNAATVQTYTVQTDLTTQDFTVTNELKLTGEADGGGGGAGDIVAKLGTVQWLKEAE